MIPDAQVVVFTKIKRFAPDFHRHILKGKIMNQVVRSGEKILVYEVTETVPPGTVRVTQASHFEFR
jgi:hypothetical protein